MLLVFLEVACVFSARFYRFFVASACVLFALNNKKILRCEVLATAASKLPIRCGARSERALHAFYVAALCFLGLPAHPFGR